MKNVPTILSALALIGVVVLFVMNSQKSTEIIVENEIVVNDSTQSEHIESSEKFAYIDVQRINSEYLFYQDVADDFEAKQKRAEAEYRKKVQAFQVEYEEYMTKAQRGAFLSQQSQQQQEADLTSKQENIQILEQNLSIKLQNEMQKLDFQVKDTIMNYLENFNKEAGYVVILNSVSILDKGKTENITDTILAILNKNYKLQKNKVAK